MIPSGPRFLQAGAYQQRLPGADHIFGEGILQFAASLGQDTIILHFQLEADFVAILECDVEIAVIENLSQLRVDGAQDFVLIQPGADGLADLGEQFVLLGATMCVVRDQIVLDGKPKLQRQPHHKTRTGSAKRLTLGMRKQNHAECVFAGLQAHGGKIANLRLFECILKAGEGPAGPTGNGSVIWPISRTVKNPPCR